MILFIAHLGVYIAVMVMSYMDGDPERLFAGQDFEGKLCGVTGQATDFGSSLENTNLLYYSMNVTTVVESTVGGLFSSTNTSTFDPNEVYDDVSIILDPWNFYETYGNSIVSSLSSNFISICSNECGYNVTEASASTRTYVWPGPTDPTMKAKWDEYVLAADSEPSLMEPFTFTALPESVCPYPPEYCVPLQYAPFTSILDMYCVPKISDNSTSIVPSSFSSSISFGFGDMIGDIKTTWPIILIMAFGGLVIAMIFLYILKLCVGVFIWLSIFLCFCLLVALAVTVLLYSQKCSGDTLFAAATVITSAAAAESLFLGDTACANGYSIQDESGRDTFRIISYVIFGLCGLYLIMVLWMFKRIRLGIAVNKVAAQFVSHNMSTLLVPLCQCLTIISWWAVWIATIVFTVTIIPATYRDMSSTWPDDYDAAIAGCSGESGVYIRSYDADGKPIFACKNAKYVLTWQFWYAIGALFWVNDFILACGQTIIAGAVGVWYFAPNEVKKNLGGKPVKTGFRNTFVYHLGTMAFGSLLVAIVQAIRLVFFWVSTLENRKPKNTFMRVVMWVIGGILWLINKILKFINKNAFIQTALLGTSFCKSCANAVSLIARNALRIGTLGMIGGIIHFLGISFITIGTGVAGWGALTAWYDGQIKSPIAPLALIFIMGYCLGSIVISVFSISVDSIFQCFLADEEMNKTQGGAKHTPSQLDSFLKHHEVKVVPEAGSARTGGQNVQVVGV